MKFRFGEILFVLIRANEKSAQKRQRRRRRQQQQRDN